MPKKGGLAVFRLPARQNPARLFVCALQLLCSSLLGMRQMLRDREAQLLAATEWLAASQTAMRRAAVSRSEIEEDLMGGEETRRLAQLQGPARRSPCSSGFLALLNSKKERIQQLEEELADRGGGGAAAAEGVPARGRTDDDSEMHDAAAEDSWSR